MCNAYAPISQLSEMDSRQRMFLFLMSDVAAGQWLQAVVVKLHSEELNAKP